MILHVTNSHEIHRIFSNLCCALETVLAYRISLLLQIVSQARNLATKSAMLQYGIFTFFFFLSVHIACVTNYSVLETAGFI